MKRDSLDQEGQLDKVRRTLKGRAEKACVRCRAKKRTCDGGNPCQRCKDSHSACYFSDWHYTVPYPREYVEYLEEQQEQLSSGLLAMYRLLKESHIKTVPPLPERPQAQDLLTALRGLRLEHQQTSHHTFPFSMESQLTNAQTMSPVEQMPAETDSRQRGHMQYQFDPAPRSPTQPGTFFHATPGPGAMNGSKILTQLPGSFASMQQYSPFELGPPAPHILVSQSYTISSQPATSPAASPSLVGLRSDLMAPMSWPPHSRPMSPGASSLDSSRAVSHQQSPPQMFTPDDNDFDQERARHWSWDGIGPGHHGGGDGDGGGLGVGYFTAPYAHDASMVFDLESIEPCGEIVHGASSGAPGSVAQS